MKLIQPSSPSPRRSTNRPEQKLQEAVVAYISLAHPKCIVAAVPNEGRRSRIGGGAMRRAGMCSGFPDLIVLAPGSKTLFIELKSKVGVLSDNQKAIHPRILTLGFPLLVARTLDEVIKFMKEQLPTS